MDLSALLTSRTVAAIGLACIALSAFAALWALVKLSYQRALGRPMPRNALTGTLDVLAELATNVVGAVSRALKLGTGEGLFRPTVPLTPVEAVQAQAVEIARETVVPHDPTQTMRAPVDRDSQRGSVSVRALLALAVLLAVVLPLGAALTGCPSSLPPVAGCEPLVQACIADRPHVCSASQRWERAGSVSCADVHGVCVVADGRAHCAAADAGAP